MGEEGRGDEREEEEARRVPRGWPHPRRRAHARVRPRDEDLDRSARRRWRTHVLRTQRGAPRVWTVQQVLPREPDVRGARRPDRRGAHLRRGRRHDGSVERLPAGDAHGTAYGELDGNEQEARPGGLDGKPAPSFLGQQAGQAAECSAETTDLIDEEVRDLVNRAYRRAKDLVETNIDVLHKVAEVLLEKENIDGD